MKSKKIIALMLSLVMIASAMPATVFADEETTETEALDVEAMDVEAAEENIVDTAYDSASDEDIDISSDTRLGAPDNEVQVTTWSGIQDAVNNAESSVTIKLGENITAPSNGSKITIGSGKVITIDLNGKTLSRGRTSQTNDGHVFYVQSGGDLTVTDSSSDGEGVITGGYAQNGGAFNNDGSLTIVGVTISGNKASNRGGAITNYGALVMRDCVVKDNEGVDGGAIVNEDRSSASMIIKDCTFSGNKSTSHGGGAIVNYASMEIKDSIITGNSAYTSGGGIWTNAGEREVSIIDTSIDVNSTRTVTGSHAGGLYIASGNITVSGGSISDNKSADGGGVFVASSGSLVLRGTKINNNSASLGEGGGIVSYAELTLDGCEVSGNSSKYDGGGILTGGSNEVTLINTTISGNVGGGTIEYAEDGHMGGGLYLNNELTTINGCIISGNMSACAGALFIPMGGIVNISDTEMTGNIAAFEDGGAIVNYGTINMNGGLSVTGNTATTLAGGICNGGTLNVVGVFIVKDNTNKETGTDNLFLSSGSVITVAGNLDSDSDIHVSVEDGTQDITAGWNEYMSHADPTLFFAMDSGMDVLVNGDTGELKTVVYYVDRVYDPVTNKVTDEVKTLDVVPKKITANSETLTSGWYIVPGNLYHGDDNTHRLVVADNADVKIILTDNTTLEVYSIVVNSSSTLSIYGQKGDNGKLIANATRNSFNNQHYAGIGSAPEKRIGTLNIYGGIIESTGAGGGAALGNGDENKESDSSSSINIYGGTINAYGGACASGIGGGSDANSSIRINIHGGVVTANGIGSGSRGQVVGGKSDFNGVINITGGIVTSTSRISQNPHFGNSAIGAGCEGKMNSTINISGGTVIATGLYGGAPIGAGWRGECTGTINITGGEVSVKIDGIDDSNQGVPAFIGRGGDASSSGTLEIGDNIQVMWAKRPNNPIPAGSRVSTCQMSADDIRNNNHLGEVLCIFESKNVELEGYSLSLDGSIGVNFYLNLSPDVTCNRDSKMVFEVPNGTGTVTQETFVETAGTKFIGNDMYYVFKCNVAAKEMSSVIRAKLVAGNKTFATYEFTVRDYAEYILDHTADSAEYAAAVPLVKALLNYGTRAQSFFGLTTTPANTSLADEDKLLPDVAIPSPAAPVDLSALDGVTFEGISVSLKSETTLSFYFRCSDGVDLTFSCSGDGYNYNVEKVSSNGYQIARIRGIKAKDIGRSLTLTVSTSDSGSKGSVTYSILNYCHNAYYGDYPDKLKDVAKALYLYYLAANERHS